MCIPKSEDHSLEIAFLRGKKKYHLLQYFFIVWECHTYLPCVCSNSPHPLPSSSSLPTWLLFPQTTCALFFPLSLLSAACVHTGEGACSRSRGRSLGARMLEESWPSLYQQPSTEGLRMAKKYGDRVGLLSFFFFFLRVNIISPEENVN